MTKSELIEKLARGQSTLPCTEIQRAVTTLLNEMSQSLALGERIEIRGFGSFALHFRPPRRARNPKTSESIDVPAHHAVHFKPGKDLRIRVNGKKPHKTNRAVPANMKDF